MTTAAADLAARLALAIDDSEKKALKSLSGYKFEMFGYWASKWVSLNQIEGRQRPNPFRFLVHAARAADDQAAGR